MMNGFGWGPGFGWIFMILFWGLWRMDGVSPTAWDLAGVAVTLAGMGIIVWGGWQT